MPKEWVVVADGNKAKILTRNGRSLDHVFPTFHKDELSKNFDKDAKKPGLIRQAFGFLGTRYSPHKHIHEQEKMEFIQEIVKILNKRVKDFDKLTLIAPSDRLGEFRSHLSSHVTNKIAKEINKDLTKKALEEVYDYMIEKPD